MNNPFFSARVENPAKASFTIDTGSVTDARGMTVDVDFGSEGHRVQRRDWKENNLPKRGDVIYFQLVPGKKCGERIVSATLLNPAIVVDDDDATLGLGGVQESNGRALDFGACKGDESVESLPHRVANTAMDEEDAAIRLAMGDIVAFIARMGRTFLSWLFKTRRIVRMP